MNYNEFGNNKTKTNNIIKGTIGVILTLIIVLILFLIFKKFTKKDNQIENQKQSYNVTIKANGTKTKEEILTCYTLTNTCQVNLPEIIRPNWQIIGWAKEENSHELDYTPGETITISENITLYAITVKNVTISLIDKEEEKLSCGIYNTNNNCMITLPNKGKGWTKELNGTKPEYMPGEKILVNEYIRLYYVK